MINVFQPSLGEEEIFAVGEVLRGGWVGRGTRTTAFEQAFAEHLGVDPGHTVGISSCTEGLFLAVRLADIGPGDEVVMPSISFVGAANAVADRGGRPRFCDVDERTLNPTVGQVAAALTPHTRAVILLHYGGEPGDVVEIAELCRARGVLLIEDAACAVASTVDGRACGTFGDIGLWSFDGAKVLVTGDGGMLTARDPELVARARILAYHGLAQVSGYSQAAQGSRRWWDFQVSEFSGRSVTNDVAAAIGLVQLRRLPGFIARRAEIAARYDAGIAEVPGVFTPPPGRPGGRSSHYFYWVRFADGVRDDVAGDLLDAGVYTTFRYAPLHRVTRFGWAGALPGAEAAAARTLCLPIHQSLTDDDVARVINLVARSVRARRGDSPGVAA